MLFNITWIKRISGAAEYGVVRVKHIKLVQSQEGENRKRIIADDKVTMYLNLFDI